MEHRHLIVSFLGAVAQRLRRRAATEGIVYLLALLGALALLSPLVAQWAELDIRSAWIVAGLAVASLLGFALLAFVIPRRRWRTTSALARYVGGRDTSISSDLLSAVEFMDETASSGSADLREALLMSTAERIAPLRLQALVPFATVRRPLAVAGVVVLLYVGVAVLAPAALRDGYRQLFAEPADAPFDGARLAESPLVGDVDIVVVFPKYTGRPKLNLPSSSGDFEAMPGSTIEVSTKAGGRVAKASILLAETDALISDEEILLDQSTSYDEAKATALQGTFRVMRETFYRFQLTRGTTRNVEARARHITIARDEVPTIELYAPADELDVAKLKRIELAYVASDDFGIDKIDLVYTPAGGEETRHPLEVVRTSRQLPGPNRAPRNAQHKYLWDLSVLPLRPGVQIEYHLEVSDNDDVLGPNIGRSLSYSLKLFSPRERHEDLIGRQQQLAQHMLELLAERLVATGANIAEHRSIQRVAASIVVEIGGLVAALKEDELATKKLHTTLQGIRGRMNKRVRREDTLLAGFERRRASDASRALEASDTAIIAELEDDVLQLSAWIERQLLENILSIADEIDASRERLAKLFEEHKRTGSQEVLDEINRELKALERKLAEQNEKRRAMPAEAQDRFLNIDALETKSCLDKVRGLLEEGDAAAAAAQMKKCDEEIASDAKDLESSLSKLREDRFSDEEKALDDMMNDLADLAQDQDDIASEAQEIYQRYSEAVSEQQKGKSEEARNVAGETLEKLKKSVSKIPKAGLTPFTKEEMTVLNKRLEDIETMLGRGELAEALSMAKHARESLKTIRDELEFSLDEAWSRKGVAAEKAARAALPVSKRLVEQLQEVTPSPSEIMNSADRKKLEKLRRRQKASRNRTSKLLKKAENDSEALPGKAGQAVKEGLAAAREHMKQAEKQMRGRDPSGARQQAKEASERLREARKSAQGAARQKQKLGQPGWRDEPVRIPGAEDYRTPEKFREEILDAMQDEAAPSGYSDQVKQYYKDITQ